ANPWNNWAAPAIERTRLSGAEEIIINDCQNFMAVVDLEALACRTSEAREAKNHPLCGWKTKG
ncbi:MAG: hypothetical protein ACYC11_13120, partial [Bellilinea sp.]